MSRTYTIGGSKLPSVTTIIGVMDKGYGLLKWVGTVGWEESRRIFKASGERGGRVHGYIQHKLTGIGPPPHLEEEDTPYVSGFNTFHGAVLSRFTVEKQESELTVYCKTCGYAGTLDWFVNFRRFERPHRTALVDWKTTSKIRDDVAIQTAAYLHAYFTSRGASCKRANALARKVERWCVCFTEDGGYRKPKRYFDYDADFTCFKHLLGVYRWQND